MILQLLYTSLSRYERGHESDLRILQSAMQSNRELGITGYLLRDTNSFCQVIEGLPEVVEPLFASIARDHRHFGVVLRHRALQPTRNFLGWSMGYASLSSEDSAYLSTAFADQPRGMVMAFRKISQLVAKH